MNCKKSYFRYITAAFLAVCLVVSAFSVSGMCFVASRAAGESITESVYNTAISRITVAAESRKSTVDLSDLKIPEAYGKELFFDALYESPEFFYISPVFNSSSMTKDSSGNIKAMTVPYVNSEYDLRGKSLALKKAVDEFKSAYSLSRMNVAEKYLAAFEYITERVSKNTGSALISVFGGSAYGALVEKSADSRGYALAYKLLCESMGLNSIIIFGNSDFNKCWNAVNVDGSYFYVDAYEADEEFSSVIGDTATRISTIDHFMFFSDRTSFEFLGHISGTNYGYGEPVAVKGSSSLKYKRFWNETSSQMIYYDGYWYCISENKSAIYKRSPNSDIPLNEQAFFTNATGLPFGLLSGDGSRLYYTTVDAELSYIDLALNAQEPEGVIVYNAYGSNRTITALKATANGIECVYKNSNGSAYSEEYFITTNSAGNGTTTAETVTYGDLNGDGKINSEDLKIISEHIKNDTEIDEKRKQFADIDRNGVIDAFDRAYIARYIAGESYIITTYFN